MNSRRHFLRSIGTMLALPTFESLGAAPKKSPGTHPTRMAFVYMPNGVIQSEWGVDGEGRNFTLRPSTRCPGPDSVHQRARS